MRNAMMRIPGLAVLASPAAAMAAVPHWSAGQRSLSAFPREAELRNLPGNSGGDRIAPAGRARIGSWALVWVLFAAVLFLLRAEVQAMEAQAVNRGAKETAFQFGEDALVLQPEHVQARVAVGISTKRDLLAQLDAGLSFPDYFGGNWDAVWECICDLEWLKPIQVVLIHEDLPLKEDPAVLRTYLSIMNDAIEYWVNRSEHDLVVVFPTDSRALVNTLVAARRSS